jgi:hypothetical protein
MDTTSASSIHKKTSFYASFTAVCFNAPLTTTTLIDLRPVIFGLTLFDWFIPFYLFLIKIGVFNYALFIYIHVCQEHKQGVQQGHGVYICMYVCVCKSASLSMPWKHIGGSVGIPPLILNVSTTRAVLIPEKESEQCNIVSIVFLLCPLNIAISYQRGVLSEIS